MIPAHRQMTLTRKTTGIIDLLDSPDHALSVQRLRETSVEPMHELFHPPGDGVHQNGDDGNDVFAFWVVRVQPKLRALQLL